MITLVPVGGLANRMKAIDSAIALAGEVQTDLRVVWYKDQGLNCRFDELFQPIQAENVKLKEASFLDLWIYDRPRKKNFYIPRPFHRLLFNDSFYEADATQRFYRGFDFKEWAVQKRVYLASCVYFFRSDNKRLFDVFNPIPALQDQINLRSKLFNTHTIGIHIRRTDNISSIEESPTELFIQQIEKEIALYDKVNFYLASDSEEDKQILCQEFGNRIITSEKPADRNSIVGMQEALIELYLLSRTCKILGSSKSSYSETAAQLSGIECIILKK